MLLAKAEALQLVEIDAGLGRGDVEGGGAGRGCGRLVDGTVEDFALLARMNGDHGLQGTKLPAEIGRGLGVETDGDDGSSPGGRRRRGALRRSAEAGRLAKEAIERHRGKRQTNHGADHRYEEERG